MATQRPLVLDGGQFRQMNTGDTLPPGVSPVESLSNVGTGQGQLVKAASGTNIPVKTIKAGVGIGIQNDADEVVVSSTGGTMDALPTAATQITKTYSSNGDTNGVFYFLGTVYGEKAWANPHTLAQIAAVRSTNGAGTVTDVFDRTTNSTYTNGGQLLDFIFVDLGASRSLVPSFYTLRNYNQANREIRTWKLQGTNFVADYSVASINAATWTDLDVRVSDTTMSGLSAWAGYTPNQANSTGFRYFRILQTGNDATGGPYLCVAEWELYGNFTYVPTLPVDGRLVQVADVGGNKLRQTSFTAVGGVLSSAEQVELRSTASNQDLLLTPNGSGVVRSSAGAAFAGGAAVEVPVASTSYSATVALTFTELPQRRTLALTGNVTFTASGYADRRVITLFISTDGSARTPTFPSGWKFVTAKPSSIPASSNSMLTLVCAGATEADVRALFENGAQYALATHSHAIADVTGLQAALDGKQASGSYAAATHTHAQADVTNLTTDLAAKAPTARTISTTAPLGGGGDLSANRTLTVSNATTTAVGVVELATDGEVAANVVVQGNDSRLSNARTPTAHQSTHAPGGSDALPWTTAHGRGTTAAKPAAAASNAGYIYYDTDLGKLQRSTGAAWEDISTTDVPTTRTISTTAPLTGGGDLSANRTLAVSNATTSAVGVVELATDGEVAANVVVQGNDSRLSNSRTPTAHQASHAPGGSDALPWSTAHGRGTTAAKPAAAASNAGYLYYDTDLGKLQRSSGSAWEDCGIAAVHTHAQADVTNLTADLAAKAPTSRTISTTAPLTGGGDLSANRTLAISSASTTAVGVVELATDGEVAANVVVQGNDSRLSNARTPTAHQSSHAAGGSDALPWTSIIGRGVTGSRPAAAASNAGYLYFDTTLGKLQRSTGSAWEDCEATTSGEANTSSNVGTGEGQLAKTKSGVNLPFKTVKAGSGITVTNNTDDVTLSLAYTASLIIPTGTINGTNVNFTLPGTPAGDVVVFVNGIAADEAAYSVVGTALVFSVAPETGDSVQVLFPGAGTGSGAGGYLTTTTPSGSINGSNTVFTLVSAPGDAINLLVTLNGLLLVPTTDYTVSGTTLTLTDAPVSGDVLRVIMGSNGPSDTPTTGGTKTWVNWSALGANPPSTNFGTYDTVSDIAHIDFDGTNLDESVMFVGYVPEGATTTGGAKVRICWSPDTATSGAARLRVRVRKADSETASWSAWTTVTSATVSNATDYVVTEITVASGDLDSITARDFFILELGRNASDTVNDTLASDAQIMGLTMEGV